MKTVYCKKCGTQGAIAGASGKAAGKVGMAAGMVGGGWIGSSIGLAGAFGAASGVLPLALVGAWLGRKAFRKLSAPTCKKCGTSLE